MHVRRKVYSSCLARHMLLKAGPFASPMVGIARIMLPRPLTSNVVPYMSKARVARPDELLLRLVAEALLQGLVVHATCERTESGVQERQEDKS